MPTFMQFSDWKKQLLGRHGLTTPDGRALYLYRLTKGDFSDLEDLLQHWLSQLLPRYGLASVAGLSGLPNRSYFTPQNGGAAVTMVLVLAGSLYCVIWARTRANGVPLSAVIL